MVPLRDEQGHEQGCRTFCVENGNVNKRGVKLVARDLRGLQAVLTTGSVIRWPGLGCSGSHGMLIGYAALTDPFISRRNTRPLERRIKSQYFEARDDVRSPQPKLLT